jgi:SPP1 gp7 family putative phage head morphogenesis protein
MPNLAQKMLLDMRAERIQRMGIQMPRGALKTPRTVENAYAVKLRAYQKEVNKQLMEVLEPLIDTYRQDATTAEIEATTEAAERAITAAIAGGAVLSGIVSNQGTNITQANDKKYSADFYTALGFNSIPPDQVNEALNSWKTENVKLIKGVNDDQIKSIETLLLRSSRDGTNKGTLTQEIQKTMRSSVKRATLIAVDQTLKLDGQIDRFKQTEAGVSHFIWRTAGDERVRPKHRALNGNKYSWKTGANGIYPKQEVRCRCWAEPSFEEILGPEFKAAPAQPIKAPMPKKPKKKKAPKPKTTAPKPETPKVKTPKVKPTKPTPKAPTQAEQTQKLRKELEERKAQNEKLRETLKTQEQKNKKLLSDLKDTEKAQREAERNKEKAKQIEKDAKKKLTSIKGKLKRAEFGKAPSVTTEDLNEVQSAIDDLKGLL